MTERQNIEADAADSQSRPGLSGMRRFSTEDNGKGPLTMKLHDLPKPSFSIGPPGQRSVPATSGNLRRNPVERGAFTPGTLTPGASGGMGMGEQPWNLFPENGQQGEANTGASRPGHSMGSDNSGWNARGGKSGSGWNDEKTGVPSLNSTTMSAQEAKAALARSASYAGDRHSTGVSGSGASTLSAGEGPSAPVANANAASTDNMPFDLASGMAGMSISGMSAAATPPSNVPSGLDRAPQPPTWGAPLPASAAAVPGSMPAPTWGNAAKQAGFNPASPYTNYYAFNPLGDSGVYGSSDAQSFDPYRRDSAYGSGVTSPMDLGMLGGNVHNRRPGPGWQMGDRSPTRSPTSSFNMSAAGRGAASGAYRPDLMYSGGGGNPQLQQSLYNTPPNMPGQRVMGYQTQGRLNASGYPDQLDYSAFGATPYGGGNMPSYGADAYRAMPGASRYEDRARGMRSPLLEEFRANRHRRWDLSDLRGHIVEFSGDQLGSRHLQTKLDTATVEERRIFFDEAMPHILTLSTDLFSNYVVQKAFEISDHVQKLDLVHTLEGHILQLSLQTYGCRVVQKAIESVMVDEQVLIVNELRGSVLKCARDQNANHVLQRILERVPADRVRFIAEACEGQVHSLATHPYGCRVLQRILENTSDVRPLIDELLKYSQALMQDQYANYVCQHLLERGTKADRGTIIAQVTGNLVNLSRHKFASNVIDKVILCADEEERRLLMDEVLRDPPAVSEMLRDQFANYCLQKFMLVIQGPQRPLLMERVAEALMQIRKYSGTFSKHLIAIEKFIANEQALAAFNGAFPSGGN